MDYLDPDRRACFPMKGSALPARTETLAPEEKREAVCRGF
jgi:hypothetical protein